MVTVTLSKHTQTALAIVGVAMFLLIVGVVTASQNTPTKPECRDGKDNDGDTKIDYPNDAGCSSRQDNDETNCGDGVCEGGETSTICPADCQPDSCSDTDGGNVPGVFGTASGYFGGVAYSASDYCVDSGNVNEHYCSGAYKQSQQQTCQYGCAFGACNPPPNSCSDSDGGLNAGVQGTVSGSQGNANFSYTDFCYSSTILTEFFCSNDLPANQSVSCTINFTFCSAGACN